MDPDQHLPQPAPDATVRAGSAAYGGTANRVSTKISSNREIAVVQADYLALANDLEQAQALASALEMELSGKTNELARFKLIWERTQGDLGKFEQDIEALRRERHTLANEAQRALALDLKLQKTQAANEDLAAKIERLTAQLAAEREAHAQTRSRLGEHTARSGESELRQVLQEVRGQIDRVLERTGGGSAAPGNPPPAASADHIEIEFSA